MTMTLDRFSRDISTVGVFAKWSSELEPGFAFIFPLSVKCAHLVMYGEFERSSLGSSISCGLGLVLAQLVSAAYTGPNAVSCFRGIVFVPCSVAMAGGPAGGAAGGIPITIISLANSEFTVIFGLCGMAV